MVIAQITKKGLVAINRHFTSAWSDKVQKMVYAKFTVIESIVKVKNVHRFAAKLCGIYREDDFIIFPRMAPIYLPAINKIFDIEDDEVLATDSVFASKKYETTTITYYDYQIIGANHIVELFETQHAVYAQLDTGMGKTLLAAAVFEKMNKKTIIVCMTIALAQQMIADFKSAFPELTIIQYDESKKTKIDYLSYDVLVFVNITFSRQAPATFNAFELLIIDEAHLYTSETNNRILWMTQNFKNVLALSATPTGHPNKLDNFPLLFFGRPVEISKLQNVDIAATNFKVSVNKIEYFGDESKPWCMNVIQNGVVSAISTINNLSRDPHRNQMISNIIVDLRKKGHGVMIFSELREHLVRIQEYLKQSGIESEISVLMSGVADDTLEVAKDNKEHVVLTTYGYSRVGISLVSMTAVVLATPRRNGTAQVIGRILRKGSDESVVREIYDIVDMNIGLKSQFSTRQKIYKERSYPMNVTKVSFKEIKYDLKQAAPDEAPKVSDADYDEFIDKLISETK